MTNFTPEYRGRATILEADKEKALTWFRQQLIDHAKAEGKDHDWIDGPDWRVTAQVQRDGNGFVHRGDGTNYMYAFYISKVGHYGDHRFVIKKDGTIRVGDAHHCARALYAHTLRNRERGRIKKTNFDEFEKRYHMSPKDYAQKHNLLGLEVSSDVLGSVTVSVSKHNFGFSTKRRLDMKQMNAFVGFINEAKQRFTGWGDVL